MPRKNAEPATERDELKVAADALIDEVINGDDDTLDKYLGRLATEAANAHRVHGVFKTWSMNNRWYLHAQSRKRGTSVKGLFAGVAQWRKMGREVRPEEIENKKAYLIFGSPVITVRNPRNGGQANAPANAPGGAAQANAAQPANVPAQRGAQNGQAPQTRYVPPPVIEVYDWTQTRSLDPDYVEPNWSVPLAAGDYTTLRALAQSSPVPVHFRDDIAAMNENGWLDASGITVDASMPVGNQIWTLTHELAHKYLDHLTQIPDTRRGRAIKEPVDEDGFTDRERCEQEAAVTQWFAMKMLGLDEQVGNDVTKAAAAYLRNWMHHDKDGNLVKDAGRKMRRKLLAKRLDAGLKAANLIVAGFQQAQAATTPPAAQPVLAAA